MEPKGGGCSVEIQILCEVEGLVCGSCSLDFVKHSQFLTCYLNLHGLKSSSSLRDLFR